MRHGAALRFEPFEVRLDTGELLKEGLPVRLRHQAFEVLVLLAARADEVVTREEIREKVWGTATFVDFDQGLNHCIKEIRAALGDHRDRPTFVETLARRGYRFIAPVTRVEPPARRRSRAGLLRRLAVLGAVAAGAALAVFLSRGTRPAAPAGRVMIAVLPFENLSGDPDQDYFASGLTEEMIAQLGRLDPARLGVVGRLPALEYQGRPGGLDAMRDDLGVSYLLEGSVRRSADRVRITARLTQLSDRRQVWSETYEAELRDILSVQRSVAGTIGSQIRLAFPTATGRPTPRQVDPEAYTLFLRGRYFWNMRERSSVEKAIGQFEKSIARQPDYAMAYVGLAQAYVSMAHRTDVAPSQFARKARAAAIKARELDPELVDARVALAGVMGFLEWDWEAAEDELRRALDLNPSDATAHHWYSHFLRSTGRLEAAMAEIRTAASLAPLSLIIGTDVGNVHLYRGELAEAERRYRSVLEMDPRFGPAQRGLARVFLARGRHPEAVAAFERAAALAPQTPRYGAWLGYAYAVTGRADEARALLARFRARVPGCSYHVAAIHAGLGERAEALAWLERAYADREPSLRYMLLDERLRELRQAPAFQSVVRRVGLVAG